MANHTYRIRSVVTTRFTVLPYKWISHSSDSPVRAVVCHPLSYLLMGSEVKWRAYYTASIDVALCLWLLTFIKYYNNVSGNGCIHACKTWICHSLQWFVWTHFPWSYIWNPFVWGWHRFFAHFLVHVSGTHTVIFTLREDIDRCKNSCIVMVKCMHIYSWVSFIPLPKSLRIILTARLSLAKHIFLWPTGPWVATYCPVWQLFDLWLRSCGRYW